MMFYEMILWLQARMQSDETGAAAVEYGLLVALIAVIVAVAMGPLATAISGAFTAATNLFN